MQKIALKFLGVGAAYNASTNNNAAYFIAERTLFLFDCGEKITDRILDLGLLNEVDEVEVFITHLHSDHIGSLEPLLYYIHFFTKKSIHIYYPDAENLHELLVLMGIDFPFEIEKDFSKEKKISIVPVVQDHIPGSYGFFVEAYGTKFFYSGDTKRVEPKAVEALLKGELDAIYHEVTISEKARIHTHISQLMEVIPWEYRPKVVLMHLANEETIRKGEEENFSIAKEE